MNKEIFKQEENHDKILSAVSKIADPIRYTLSPKGSYTILEDEVGNRFVTNDGATIARSISVEDPVEDTVIEIIKDASLKTNTEAGDGTSSSVLLSSILIKEGMQMIKDDYNRVDVSNFIEDGMKKILNEIDKLTIQVKGDKDLRYIAQVSSNNDSEITEDVVKVVKTSGVDGHVILESGFKDKTEIIEDKGFVLEKGLFDPSLKNTQDGRFFAQDIPVLVTDKRIYYKEEAQTILKTCLDMGYKKIAIIAKDFIGEAPNMLVANHTAGNMEVCLIKLGSDKIEDYDDIATYLGGKVVAEKRGKIVDKLTPKDFCLASQVLSYQGKTILSPTRKVNPELSMRVETLKKELNEEDKNSLKYNELKRRISSLTTGLVTVRVGGRTPKEIREKLYRYEDALSAVLSAKKFGYLPGAGVALYKAFKKAGLKGETEKIYKKVCQASITQIAENCDLYPKWVLEQIDSKGGNWGYDANKGEFRDVLKGGIIDPYKATVLALANAVSVALIIIKSRYLILTDYDKEEQSGGHSDLQEKRGSKGGSRGDS